MICRRSLVSGRVQGVFYRATCVKRAEALGLRGYAKNLPDGRVEVLTCGEPGAVEQFTASLWEGSPASRVEDVSSADCDPAEFQRIVGFTSA